MKAEEVVVWEFRGWDAFGGWSGVDEDQGRPLTDGEEKGDSSY